MSTQSDASEADTEVVYDHPSDPYIGEFVRFETPGETILGKVLQATETENGVTVSVKKGDGTKATIAWSLIELVDSTHRTKCSACGFPSSKVYRCESCGHDLAGDRATSGQQGGDV